MDSAKSFIFSSRATYFFFVEGGFALSIVPNSSSRAKTCLSSIAYPRNPTLRKKWLPSFVSQSPYATRRREEIATLVRRSEVRKKFAHLQAATLAQEFASLVNVSAATVGPAMLVLKRVLNIAHRACHQHWPHCFHRAQAHARARACRVDAESEFLKEPFVACRLSYLGEFGQSGLDRFALLLIDMF